jgi:signal peptidase I
MTAVLTGTAVIALFIVLASALFWRLDGGRWYDVRTASMGRAAPVGTLLLTRPTTVSEVHLGDVITFHAPGSGAVYSHRVVQKTAAGISTRGDINPVKDAWTIHDRDLVGVVVHTVPGVGWLLRGLPLLLLCLAVTWLASAFVRRAWRDSVRIVGAAASLGVIGLVLRPWVGLLRISTASADEGVVLRVVSTGLLPIRATAAHGGGDSARLVNGGVADIAVPHAGPRGAYDLTASLSLGFWWWVGLVGVSLAPLLWCLVVGLSPVEEKIPGNEGDTGNAGDENDVPDRPEDPPETPRSRNIVGARPVST